VSVSLSLCLCVRVCLSVYEHISGTAHTIFYACYLCMFPQFSDSVAIHWVTLPFAETKVSNFNLRPKCETSLICKHLKPHFRPIVPSHWQMQKKIKNFQHSIHGGYYTTISYDVIHDEFVLFTFA